MKRFVRLLARTFRGTVLIAGLAALQPNGAYSAATGSVEVKLPATKTVPAVPKIQVNDTLVVFPDVQPYVNEGGTLVVPVRSVAEALGAKVEVEEYRGAVHVLLRRDEHRLELFCGSGMAFMDGLPDKPEAAPVIKDGRVTAPLRTLLRWMDMDCEWDEETAAALISADGKRHETVSKPAAAKTGLILETLDNYLGVPYVWGGTKPTGFDCSGFVQYVYRRHGVELPRTSREMYAVGTAVRELQPGDLVFFSTKDKTTSHVGVYIGDNQFISATTSYGVHVASLHSTYWGPKYIGAKRVL